MAFEKSLALGEQFETRYALPWLLKNFPDYWITDNAVASLAEIEF